MPLTEVVEIPLKLVPFVLTVILYFSTLYLPPSGWAALVKCLPCLSLVLFIALIGYGQSKQLVYRQWITLGLLFSTVGDAFLVWDEYFIFGMAGFAGAHMSYITAFGFYPLQLTLGIVLYVIASIMIFFLLPGLSSSLMFAVPLYCYLLTTMSWRVLATIPNTTQYWMRLDLCIAGIFWLLTDGFLGVNEFRYSLPYSRILIMGTYYLAQFCITMTCIRQDLEPTASDVSGSSSTPNNPPKHPINVTPPEKGN